MTPHLVREKVPFLEDAAHRRPRVGIEPVGKIEIPTFPALGVSPLRYSET